jgi:hypothetical protein
MLTSSNFKSNKNKQALVIFSLASLFLFGFVLKTEAKLITVGTTTDTIYMGGNLGIGLTNPGYKLEIAAPTASTLIPAAVFHLTGGQNWGNVLSLTTDASAGVDEPRLLFNYANGAKSWSIGGYNTGAPNTFNIWENSSGNWGTQRLTVIPGGNVGIGATTPYANLQIGQSTGGIVFSSPSKIKIIGSAQSTTDEVFLNLVRDRNPGNQFAGAASFRLNSFAGGTGGAPPTSQLTIALKSTSDNTDVANVDVMTLRDTGNVGIGATAPGTKLDVSGTFRNSLATTHSLLAGSGNVVVMADNTGALYSTTQASLLSGVANFWGGTKNGNIWNGDAGAGNVGIGTTAPGGKLAVSGNALFGNVASGSYVTPSQVHIGGTNVAQLSMEDVGVTTAGIALDGNNLVFGHQNSTARYSFRYSSTYNGDYANSGTDIAWLQNGTQYLSGNVGIGTTNPGSYKLNVAGDITGSDYVIQNASSFSNLNAPSLLGAVYGNDILQDLFAFNAPSSYEVYNGSTWTAGTVPSSVFDGKNSQAWGDLTIPHDTPSVRFTWNSFGYRFWDALAFVHSTNGNTFNATLQWSTDGVNFTDFFTTPNYGSWPGYSVYKNSGNNSGKTPYLRLVLNFSWGANTNSVSIGAISMPGSYGGFTRLYDWDYSRNVTFPASLTNSLATKHSLLGGSGNVVVMSDNTGTLYSTPLATFASANSLWGGTKNGNIWNGDAGVGNVGIGTTAPSEKLQVVGNAQFGESGAIASTAHPVQIRNSSDAFIDMVYSSVRTWDLGIDSGANFFIRDVDGGNSKKLTINTSGNVGIGTTAPKQKLDVIGNVGIGAVASNYADEGFNLHLWPSDVPVTGYGYGTANPANIMIEENDAEQSLAFLGTDSATQKIVFGRTSSVSAGQIAFNQSTSQFDVAGGNFNVAGNVKANHLVQGALVARPYATWGASGASTGAVIIKLPGTSGNYGMVHMQIDVYEYGSVGATTYICGGHNWNSRWYNYSCSAVGTAAKKIRLAFKDGQYAVVLGDNTSSWSYGQVVLSKITNGSYYSGTMDLGGAYTITQDASAESYTWISEDLSGLKAYNFQNYSATTHSLLGGSGNTVVLADNNGTLYNTPLATFMSSGLWGGTKNGNIWNGDAGAGNVGIGTTAPDEKLYVAGNVKLLSGNLLATSNGSNNLWSFSRQDGITGVPSLAISGYQGIGFNANITSGLPSSYQMYINNSGNIGIGITNPGRKLHVAGDILMNNTNSLWSGSGNKVRNGGFGAGYDGVATSKGWGFTLVSGSGVTSGYPSIWDSTDWTVRDGDGGTYGSTLAVNTNSANGEYYVYSDFFSVTAGRMHSFQGLLANHRMNWVKLRLVTYLADKTTVVNSYYGTFQGNGTTTECLESYSGGRTASGYCNMWGTFTPNDSEKFARVELVANGQKTGQGDGWLFADQIAVTEGSQPVAWTRNTWDILPNRDITNYYGNVGIGKATPSKALDVVGDINASLTVNATGLCIGGVCKTDWNSLVPISGNVTLTGPLTIPGLSLTGDLDLNWHNIRNVTKLTVGTIDPLYSINGIKYSTYAASMSGGVKEEYTGKVSLKNKNIINNEYEAIIDFAKVEKGSDLWVWRKVIDFNKENVDVSITPYGQLAQVYYLINNNKLIFRSDKPVEISYRLTARRFDWREWPTKAIDQTEETKLIIND